VKFCAKANSLWALASATGASSDGLFSCGIDPLLATQSL
jgi:hypothetical protein